MSSDEGLAATADHAVRSKVAAVAEGYWHDDFVRCFSLGRLDGSPGPLINRGQYARVAAISSAVEQFMLSCAAAGHREDAQIVSLGAGLDTCFWQLEAAGTAPRLYVEIDQLTVVSRKCGLIKTKPALLHALRPDGAQCVGLDGVREGGHGYRLLAADLNSVTQVEAALNLAGWRPDAPTLLIAECVLVYMRPEASRSLLSWFGSRCPTAMMVAFEMCGPDDPFGRTMLDNLRRRGCPLLGLSSVPDVRAQEARCLESGWGRCQAVEMLRYFERIVGEAERARVCKLGLLDELEEWRLLMAHYCIVLAVSDRGAPAGGGPSLFGAVDLLATPSGAPLSTLLGGGGGGSVGAGSGVGVGGGGSAALASSGGGVPSFIESGYTTKVEYEKALAAGVAGLAVGAAGGGGVGGGDGGDGGTAAMVDGADGGSGGRPGKWAPPLMTGVFDECDEDAVWSDEEGDEALS